MRIVVTGPNGFIGKNLICRLKERGNIEIVGFDRSRPERELCEIVRNSDLVFHLAGVNRPQSDVEFEEVNFGLTKTLVDGLKVSGKKIPVIFSSSIHSQANSPYGRSKKAAEDVLLSLGSEYPVFIYRLPNVFGKWSRPNYNSVVATFCHNIARGLPVSVHDPEARVQLVYVDDVVDDFVSHLDMDRGATRFPVVSPEYSIAVGDLLRKIQTFLKSRETLITEDVGFGLDRALYSTYLSFLEANDFSYILPAHTDARGTFVEMLKTKASGQFSFFTAKPGVTRGRHYHHSKTEKFLVVSGRARFRFRNIITLESKVIEVGADNFRVVETIPGWAHDITNIGDSELVVMLWANEIFNPEKPDTIFYKDEM
jgi:UDP-2-acetamido-2,6-beta-L-arabino-hexul-4-ose reductase